MSSTVILVGLMGSGKTTVGRRLGTILGRRFVDADHALEDQAGRTIGEIFESEGEAAFRDLETSVLTKLLGSSTPMVVASGGGVVLRSANRELLASEDITVVWLDASPEFLSSRVESTPRRPLLAGGRSPHEVLRQLRAERAPLYAAVADVIVSVEPYHRRGERPKVALAERIAELVRARERASSATGAERG